MSKDMIHDSFFTIPIMGQQPKLLFIKYQCIVLFSYIWFLFYFNWKGTLDSKHRSQTQTKSLRVLQSLIQTHEHFFTQKKGPTEAYSTYCMHQDCLYKQMFTRQGYIYLNVGSFLDMALAFLLFLLFNFMGSFFSCQKKVVILLMLEYLIAFHI